MHNTTVSSRYYTFWRAIPENSTYETGVMKISIIKISEPYTESIGEADHCILFVTKPESTESDKGSSLERKFQAEKKTL